jgi:hypothetical protein
MNRLYQITLVASTVGLSWLGMQVGHEVGHVLAAWACGEEVYRVVLHPLAISRTDTSHERHPLLVIWGGPLIGVLLPLGALGLSKLARPRLVYMFRFFAGFCLIANGAYLGVGSFDAVGDTGDLLRYGAPLRALVAFGLVCVPLGLALWNGLGPRFGLGRSRGEVDRSTTLGMLGLLSIVVLVEILVGIRQPEEVGLGTWTALEIGSKSWGTPSRARPNDRRMPFD